MELPADLRAALQAELETASTRELASASRELSQRYRANDARTDASFLHSPLDATAYIAYRLPATFAAIRAVLDEVCHRRPDFQPKSLLDVGAGPGTTAWAATEAWPYLERVTMLERDARMIQLGKSLAVRSTSPAIRKAVWSRVDVALPWEIQPADITVAAYMLGELPPETRADFVRRLWECSTDICIIVEPGTPRGFALIREASDHLVRAGAHIMAPFPHDWQCLESEDDWCHFSQRVPRTRAHRSAKEATLSYEDEKYSYIAGSRVEGLPIVARVIRHPQVRSGHVRLVLCTADGVKHVVVTRGMRDIYRKAKGLNWGSAILPEDARLYGLTP